MRLLLDTHIALWAVAEPNRLTRKVQDLIIDPENDVAVSIAALWEIAIKRSTGRTRSDIPALSPKQAAHAFADASFTLLSLSTVELEIVEDLPLHHRDPFDRLFIATALAGHHTLLTHDKTLAAYGDFVMVV